MISLIKILRKYLFLGLIVFLLCHCGLQGSHSFMSSSFHPGYPIHTLDPSWTPEWASIVAVWHLNETSRGTASGGGDFWDATGNGHNGTISGNVTMGVPGVVSLAAAFDGATGFATIANIGTLPVGLHPRTLCAWGITPVIPTGCSWMAAWGTAGIGEATFTGIDISSLDAGGYTGVDLVVNSFWNINTWHHICSTYDGTKATLYADGIQVAGPTTLTWNTVTAYGYIGKQVNGGQNWPIGTTYLLAISHNLSTT